MGGIPIKSTSMCRVLVSGESIVVTYERLYELSGIFQLTQSLLLTWAPSTKRTCHLSITLVSLESSAKRYRVFATSLDICRTIQPLVFSNGVSSFRAHVGWLPRTELLISEKW